jgi:hypothetical protein
MILWLVNLGFAGGDGGITAPVKKQRGFIQNVNKGGLR